MDQYERRFIVHDRIVQLLARASCEARNSIDPNAPDAAEKREALKAKLQADIKEFNRFYFGKGVMAECWLCPYREWVEQAQIKRILKGGER